MPPKATKKKSSFKLKDYRQATATVQTQMGKTVTRLGDPTPAPEYLMIQQARRPRTSEGGIDLPDNAYEEPMPYGLIVKVGETCKRYKVGQHVLLTRFGGHCMPIGETIWIFVRESDVVGTLTEIPMETEPEGAPPLGQDGMGPPH